MPESKDKKMASKYHTWVAGTRNLARRPGNSEVKKVKPQKPESGEDTSWDLRFSPPNKEQGGRLSESSCYQLRLATGQTPLSNRNKDIRATQAIPVAFARSLLLKSTCRASKTRFSVLRRKRSHFICSHSSKSPLRKQAVFSQAKVCLSKCVHVS